MKQYLVTGGGSGLGLSIVRFLAEKGHSVFACDINVDNLTEQNLSSVIPVEMDVSRAASVEKGMMFVSSKTTILHGVVNCAGVFRTGTMVDALEEEWDLVMEVNVKGMYLVTKTFFPLLYQARGRVVNISSEVARMATGFNGLYSISKYAVEAYSDALRQELLIHDMKVAIVQPGPVATPLLDANRLLFQEAARRSVYFKPQLEKIASMVDGEKGKAVSPDVIAALVYRGLTDRWPKARYPVNHDRGRAFLSLLPSWLSDRLFRAALK